jgi:hypothetical protein
MGDEEPPGLAGRERLGTRPEPARDFCERSTPRASLLASAGLLFVALKLL